jgi:hypothetical protein
VRTLIGSLLLCLGVLSAPAQEQEKKLVDRLLKPDLTLQNAAQGKQFHARSNRIEKQVPLRSFYIPEKSLMKTFQGEREYVANTVTSPRFRYGSAVANVTAPYELPTTAERYRSMTAALPKEAPGSGRVMTVSNSSETNRPFLGRGKSQKALSQKDTPLTIDQVRELLNKNK